MLVEDKVFSAANANVDADADASVNYLNNKTVIYTGVGLEGFEFFMAFEKRLFRNNLFFLFHFIFVFAWKGFFLASTFGELIWSVSFYAVLFVYCRLLIFLNASCLKIKILSNLKQYTRFKELHGFYGFKNFLFNSIICLEYTAKFSSWSE